MVGIGGSDSYADGDAGNFPPHSVTLCTKQNTFHLIRGFRVGAQDGDSRGSRLLQGQETRPAQLAQDLLLTRRAKFSGGISGANPIATTRDAVKKTLTSSEV